MSTALIVGILAGSLFILVTFAITLQSIEKNRKEKRRLESALNARARNFQYLLDGFPQGFLSRDLQVLVCKCLADVYEQLVRTVPGNSSYKKQLDLNAERLKLFLEKPETSQSVPLGNQAQIIEVQKLLKNLHKFIATLLEAKRISAPEAKSYSQQIKRLMIQTTIESIDQQISDAIVADKPRLALHHINTAIEKLSRENTGGQYSAKISDLEQQLAEVQQKVSATSVAMKEESEKEWEELGKDDESWKKKAIYD